MIQNVIFVDYYSYLCLIDTTLPIRDGLRQRIYLTKDGGLVVTE